MHRLLDAREQRDATAQDNGIDIEPIFINYGRAASSVWTMLGLPKIIMSPPGWRLSRATSSAMFSLHQPRIIPCHALQGV